jgi:tripartite-type tricarboxylate transporter receptor subunit TctC
MRFLTSIVFTVLALVGQAAAQETYPNKPVRIIVGWAPGGGADLAARVIAQKLSTKWGQQVFVDNRSGATGLLGDGAVARAAPDGYTLLMAINAEVTSNPYLQPNIPKYFDDDLVPVMLAYSNPMAITVDAKGGINSLDDLVKLAKDRPGMITYATPGTGSIPHLAGELFFDLAGIKLTQVPYRGGSPAAVSVVAGETNTAIVTTSTVNPFEKSGRLKVLAITSAKRLVSDPSWPTIAELGYPGYEVNLWSGLFVRKETPTTIVAKLERDFRAVVADPEVAKQFENLGAEPGNISLAQFKEMIAKEIAVNKRIIELTKMQVAQ